MDICRSLGVLSATIFLLGSMARATMAKEPEPVTLSIGGLEIFGSGTDLVNFGFGSFDIARERGGRVHAGTSAASQIEYRFEEKLLVAGPLCGLIANGDGGVMGYGGIYFDTALIVSGSGASARY